MWFLFSSPVGNLPSDDFSRLTLDRTCGNPGLLVRFCELIPYSKPVSEQTVGSEVLSKVTVVWRGLPGTVASAPFLLRLFIFLFLRQNLAVESWLAWPGTLCRSVWPWTQGEMTASAPQCWYHSAQPLFDFLNQCLAVWLKLTSHLWQSSCLSWDYRCLPPCLADIFYHNF